MISPYERRIIIKQNKFSRTVAKAVKHTLKNVLLSDANSTSCMYIYQPKQPKELTRFRSAK